MDVKKIEPVGPAPEILAEKRAARGPLWLNVGCGTTLRRSWLNCDLQTLSCDGVTTEPGIVYLVNGACAYLQQDALKPFPLGDSSIRYIYSEHFIEHIPIGGARDWLTEMRRVLVREGTIRLATPDLEQFTRGYLDEKQELFKQWLDTLLEHLKEPIVVPDRPAYLFNIQMREWGHQWFYDFDELACVLSAAGFSGIVRRAFRQGLATCAELDQEWRKLGTLYVEARTGGN